MCGFTLSKFLSPLGFVWALMIVCVSNAAQELAIHSVVVTSTQPAIHTAIYTQPTGQEMIGPSGISLDDGHSWIPYTPTPNFSAGLPYGYRRNALPPVLDPGTGRFLQLYNATDTPGLDPNVVEPIDLYSSNYLRYSVSVNAGRSYLFNDEIITAGQTPDNPVPGITINKNAMFIGDIGSIPLFTRSGKILVPASNTVLGPNGQLSLPGGSYSYENIQVLSGTWGANNHINWTASQPVLADPTRTTRGLSEPTLAQMPDGRIMMIMRGSNESKNNLPSYKWLSVSSDDGATWTQPTPWTYDNGQNFFSPSSMSQLLTLVDGRTFWIGNINSTNSQGNNRRWPVVIGEVNPTTLQLEQSTLLTIDTKQPGDPAQVDISHFRAFQDRVTGDIILTVPHYLNGYQSVYWSTFDITVAAVPEPSSFCIAITGGICGGLFFKHMRHKKSSNFRKSKKHVRESLHRGSKFTN